MEKLRRMKDKVGQAGARVARAQLNLELAQKQLAEAKNAVLNFDFQPRYDVRLTSSGSNKISVIKAIREITNLGLKESKDITDFAGWAIDARAIIKANATEEEAAFIGKKIEEAGGIVEARSVDVRSY